MSTTTALFPNETAAYREARDRLLAAEIELKDARERVAEMRRALPAGPAVSTRYVFQEGPRDLGRDAPVSEVTLDGLFAGAHDNLILINYMYGPHDEAPCPMCTMWADGYDAVAPHLEQRAGFALVAAVELERLRAIARERGWRNIRLLSSHGTSFNRDYRSENDEGNPTPGVTVFRREPDGTLRLHYYTEMMVAGRTPPIPGQNERGIDLFTPVWNLLDLLPEGRGDWYPSLSYA
jgi:predicted dithiol-disulfide oxidoreductase (DUF899 family)